MPKRPEPNDGEYPTRAQLAKLQAIYDLPGGSGRMSKVLDLIEAGEITAEDFRTFRENPHLMRKPS